MIKKLRRLSTVKCGVLVQVEVIKATFSYSEFTVLDKKSAIHVAYEKNNTQIAGTNYHNVVDYGNEAVVNFDEAFQFNSTLYNEPNGIVLPKICELRLRQKIEGDKYSSYIGKVVIRLHEIAESHPTHFRLPITKHGGNTDASLEIVVTINPPGPDYIPDDVSTMSADEIFSGETEDGKSFFVSKIFDLVMPNTAPSKRRSKKPDEIDFEADLPSSSAMSPPLSPPLVKSNQFSGLETTEDIHKLRYELEKIRIDRDRYRKLYEETVQEIEILKGSEQKESSETDFVSSALDIAASPIYSLAEMSRDSFSSLANTFAAATSLKLELGSSTPTTSTSEGHRLQSSTDTLSSQPKNGVVVDKEKEDLKKKLNLANEQIRELAEDLTKSKRAYAAILDDSAELHTIMNTSFNHVDQLTPTMEQLLSKCNSLEVELTNAVVENSAYKCIDAQRLATIKKLEEQAEASHDKMEELRRQIDELKMNRKTDTEEDEENEYEKSRMTLVDEERHKTTLLKSCLIRFASQLSSEEKNELFEAGIILNAM
jgi:hypothetical protein